MAELEVSAGGQRPEKHVFLVLQRFVLESVGDLARLSDSLWVNWNSAGCLMDILIAHFLILCDFVIRSMNTGCTHEIQTRTLSLWRTIDTQAGNFSIDIARQRYIPPLFLIPAGRHHVHIKIHSERHKEGWNVLWNFQDIAILSEIFQGGKFCTSPKGIIFNKIKRIIFYHIIGQLNRFYCKKKKKIFQNQNLHNININK